MGLGVHGEGALAQRSLADRGARRYVGSVACKLGGRSMNKDVTVEVRVGPHDYQGRMLNEGGVNIYSDGSLVGSGDWDGERIVHRAPSVGSAVYDAVESAIRGELGGEMG